MGIADAFSGRKILEEVQSPVNGKLTVVYDFAWGTHILAGGITQSGGIAESIWRSTLKKIRNKRSLLLRSKEIKNCLILGLGGGGIAKLVRKRWPQAEITGVDIDPVIVDLGKKHMGLDKSGVQIKIDDTEKFVKKNKEKYDLVCVDMYIGDEFPKKFESDEFLKIVKNLLTGGGVAVFNRLYYDDKRPLAMKFLKKLEAAYLKVEVVYPEANIIFVCGN